MRSKHKGLFASDMDGTLVHGDGEFISKDIKALSLLGESGYLRVIATGRSPFSFDRLMKGRKLPVDYLVLSNGAGIQNYQSGEFFRENFVNAGEIKKIADYLVSIEVDFCIQDVFPENHRFVYHQTGGENEDLRHRIELYSEHCREMEKKEKSSDSSQVVVIIPPGNTTGKLEQIRQKLDGSYSVIRTTSPLDGKSLWVEIFAKGVSKSTGAAHLAAMHGISVTDTAAIGNDYNDYDLLEWVENAYVVPHSPPSLLSHYRPVSYNGGTGVAEAIKIWLKSRGEAIPEGYDI